MAGDLEKVIREHLARVCADAIDHRIPSRAKFSEAIAAITAAAGIKPLVHLLGRSVAVCGAEDQEALYSLAAALVTCDACLAGA